jgi:hypothetical protein
LSGGVAILILIYLVGKYLISQKENAGWTFHIRPIRF